jgi:hypothetical protein
LSAASGATLYALTLDGTAGRTVTVDVGSNTLTVGGTLDLQQPVTVAASAGSTTTVSGKVRANSATVIPGSPVRFTTNTTDHTKYQKINWNGGLDTSAPPNHVVISRLRRASPGLTLNVSETTTWSSVTFSDLDSTKAEGGYYLLTTGTAQLTLTDVRFVAMVDGVLLDGGVFDANTDPGTIDTTSTAGNPKVYVSSYFTNASGIGGTTSDGDDTGTQITWGTPTAVVHGSFTVAHTAQGRLILWEGSGDRRMRGYAVEGDDGRGWRVVSPEIEMEHDGTEKRWYGWVDATIVPGMRYRLIEITRSGMRLPVDRPND